MGLGRLVVQSSLGESLRAEVDVTSITLDEANNLRVRVAPSDAYRVAGIDYNPVLTATSVSLQKRADGSNYLQIVSDRVVQEPAVDVILEMSWTTGRLMREYTLLFDPPVTAAQTTAAPPVANLQPTLPVDASLAVPLQVASAAASASDSPVAAAAASAPDIVDRAPELQVPASAPDAPPVVNSAPAPAPAPEVAPPALQQPPVVSPPVTPPVEEVAPKKSGAPKEGATAPTEYRVKRGDSLTAIAQRNMLSGVSLEQMLVGLFRGNAPAFVASNMNRLKSGVLISIPDQAQVAAIDPAQARQLIHVQSADFNAYRQRLAAAVPAPVDADVSRQATSTGKVQTEVQDRHQAAAPTKDRLTIDKKSPAAKGGVAAPLTREDKIAADRAQRDAADRKGELQRNLEDLKKLQAASSSNVPGVASVASSVEAKAASARGSSVLPPMKTASSALGAATVASAAASVTAEKASTVALVASSGASAGSAPETVVPVKPVASGVSGSASNSGNIPHQAIPAASAPAAAEPSLLDSLSDNPYVLPGAGLVLALLAGLGYYRLRGKGKDEAGVSSFLESRLQPDSFFGASGGQRVDTRDASAAPSSMSYSLSQIDAIGDVDPVAEADVYLAYGRDLQAEEILKEALRSSPDRLAIRSKLLEVYAKRRDVKGFESMAGELYGLTDGHGEEWVKAQELGRSIDPENPLYEPGGHPQGGASMGAGEPLGATTMPQSVVPSASRFQQSNQASMSSRGMPSAQDDVSIDLDISVPSEIGDDFMSPRSAPAATPSGGVGVRKAAESPSHVGSGSSIDFNADDFDLPKMPSVGPVSLHDDSHSLDFGAVSLDFDLPPSATPAQGASEDAESDPWVRKIELADEFRQIGDIEGARDMLLEVVEKANPSLKAKAKRMLDSLG
ncbi:FimV/HubP family polar landmark protein [Leptothrix ochracea]|uniref:FimV/HubP family polar landmark protein n=1 Tax=Leptothrix ochracea TaxID=735331 RepID=UPI0034E2F621